MSRAIRVILADEYELLRSGIRLILEQVPTIRVVGEARGAEDAIEIAASLQPDVVVADLSSPTVIRRFKQRNPEVRLLVLSASSDPAYVAGSLQAGADGYVLKQSPTGELVQAVVRLGLGGYQRRLIDPHLNFKGRWDTDGASGLLSDRECEVLELVASGLTSKGIAKQLQLSPRTIGNRRARIMAKFDVDNCVRAAAQALQLGLISLRDGPPGPLEKQVPQWKLNRAG